MNRKSFSALRKILAALLSFLIVAGTLVVVPVISGSAREASPDEAKVPLGSGTPALNELVANEGVKSAKTGDKNYFDVKNLSTLEVLFQPKEEYFDETQEDKIIFRFGEDNNDVMKLTKRSEGYKIEKSAGNYKLTIDLKKALGEDITAGKYRFAIGFIKPEKTYEVNQYSGRFEVLDSSFDISDFTFSNSNNTVWTKDDVTVSFTVNREIVDTVTCKSGDKDVEVSESNGTYSFVAASAAAYKVTATDKFGYTAEKTTDSIKKDANPPIIETPLTITKSENDSTEDMTGKWCASTLRVSFKLLDDESGVKDSTVKVKGGGKDYAVTSSDGAYTFYADKMQDYVISYEDNASNSNSYTLGAENVKIDNTAAQAKDVTITFSADESDPDAVLRKLSFGLYDNRKVYASVDVKSDGLSPVTSVSLLNGTSELTGSDGKFELPVLETEDGKYDLNVVVTDEAGNRASLNMFKDEVSVKIKNKDQVEELLNETSRKSFEVIISEKIKPDTTLEASKKTENNEIPAGAVIAANPKDEIAGLKSAVLLMKKESEADSEFKEIDSLKNSEASKVTGKSLSYTVPASIESGKYVFKVVAVNNCGNEDTISKTYTIDTSAPVIDENITYENNADEQWTNKDVKVTVNVADDMSGIKTVCCRKSDESEDKNKVISLVDSAYSFTATEYASYIITVFDNVGNKSSFTTKTVKIDKEKPQLDGSFSYSTTKWTNKPVTVTFKAKDLPANNSKSGIASVKVDGEAIDENNGSYSFDVKEYGKKTVVITDNAGNSDSFETDVIKYDSVAPTVTGISVENGTKYSDTGVYSNKELAVVFTVNNNGDNPSPLDAANAMTLSGDNSDLVKFVKSENNQYFYKIVPEKAAKIITLKFNVKDTAGNVSKDYAIKPKDKALSVQIAEDLDDDVYSLLCSYDDADIDDTEITGLTNTYDIYSGEKGVLKSEFIDNTAGIDAVKVEFGKVKLSDDPLEVELTNVTSSACESFDSSKLVKSVPVSYQTPKLESGRYIFRLTVRNNAGNTLKKYKEFFVDNDAPVIKSISFDGNISNADNNGVYANSAVTAAVTIDDSLSDSVVSSGITDVKLINSEGTLSKNAKNESKAEIKFTLDVNNDKPYRDIKFTVEDNCGNGKDVTLPITGFEPEADGKTLKPSQSFEIVASDNKTNIENITELSGDKKNVFEGVSYDLGEPFISDKNVMYVKKDGDIFVTFRDSLSGIDVDKTTVNLNGKKVEPKITPQKSGSKVESIRILFNTADVFSGGIPDGEYEIAYTVFNNSGVSIEHKSKFSVDKTAPVVESIGFAPADKSTAENVFNVLTFGLFSNNDVKVTLTINDASPSCGIVDSDVSLDSEAGFKVTPVAGSFSKNGNKYTKDFTISVTDDADKSNYKDLTFTVDDNLSNEIVGAYHSTNVTINGSKKSVDNNFDIILNNSDSTIKLDLDYDKGDKVEEDGFLFEGFDYGAKIDGLAMYSDNKTQKGKLSARFYDELNGINKIEASISPDGAEAQKLSLTTDNLPSKKNENVKATIDISALKIVTARCVVTFKVTNNAGNTKEFATKFGLNIDETAPVIEKVVFKKSSTSGDQILNLLTFGLYSNKEITMEVTASDEVSSSGLGKNGIEITREEADGRISMNNTQYVETKDGKEFYKRTFTLKLPSDNSNGFFNAMNISVTDNFKNSTSYTYNTNKDSKLEKWINKASVILDSEEISLNSKDFEKFSDIVSTDEKPVISNTKVTANKGVGSYIDEKGKPWFNGNFTYSADIEDNNSKIQKIKVFVNGENVTDSATFVRLDKDTETDTLNVENGIIANVITHTGYKENLIRVKLDTSKIASNILHEGTNNYIYVQAWGNNSEKIQSDRTSVALDYTAPVITDFSFDSAERSNNAAAHKSNDKPVEETDYGYFFKEEVKVTVSAEDIEGGVGVKSITYYLVDAENGDETIKSTKKVNDKNAITFTVSASFKGRIFAKASDFVENIGNYYNPKDTIAEDKDMHDDETSIEFTLESTPYKDNNGRNLYANSTTVKASVMSLYAGIGKISYSVTAPHGKQSDNYEASIQIPKDCRKLNSVSGWSIDDKDRNLATEMSGNIKVDNNSNDIVVKVTVTDRAGYSTTKSKKLSIDKTAPRIEVKYDNNSFNKLENTEYFNKDRTATVTVYERNFNPDNFKAAIKNTMNGKVPSMVKVSGWSKGVIDSKNPDNTAHIVKYTFHDDGDYEVGFDCKDVVKNAAKSYGTKKFTIDQTKPEINITFDNNSAANGNYYNSDRTATITIKEHNFWADYVKIKQGDAENSFTVPNFTKSSGDTWTATIHFGSDGNYAFVVNFKDRALNNAEEKKADRFYIDKTKGKIEFINVNNEHSYSGIIAPVVKYDDPNFQTKLCEVTKISLDTDNYSEKNEIPSLVRQGSGNTFNYADFPHEARYDGVYLMKATLVDLAGNTTEEKIVFSVNRFGSTFVLLDEKSDTLVHKKHYTNDAPDLVISEINVDTVSKSSIKLSRNDDIVSLSQGKDYKVVMKGEKNKWHRYDYIIDKASFTAEGKYTVTLTTTDFVKKTLTNRTAYKNNIKGSGKIDRTCPVSFVVDKTAPNIVVSGIESNGMYEEASMKVNVICEDVNIKSDDLKVMFDNKELKKGEYEISESAGTIQINTRLDADGNTAARNFTVTVSDKAGNVGKNEIKEFYLSATWFARLIHYHLWLIITIGAVVLAGIGFGLFMLTKKRKRENIQ